LQTRQLKGSGSIILQPQPPVLQALKAGPRAIVKARNAGATSGAGDAVAAVGSTGREGVSAAEAATEGTDGASAAAQDTWDAARPPVGGLIVRRTDEFGQWRAQVLSQLRGAEERVMIAARCSRSGFSSGSGV
jgi:hypothetical protein